jgi:hypothetical protein
MLAFAHVMDLFAYELPRLRRRGFALSLVLLRTLQCFTIRHVSASGIQSFMLRAEATVLLSAHSDSILTVSRDYR